MNIKLLFFLVALFSTMYQSEISSYEGLCYGCIYNGYEYCNGYPDENYNIIDGKCYDSLDSSCLRPATNYM